MRTFLCSCFLALSIALPASAATIRGVVSDATGSSLPSAHVVVRDIATGQEKSVDTDAQGHYQIEVASAGSYLVIVSRTGFSEVARTVVIDRADASVDVPISLELGVLTAQVSVTASRAEREVRQIPLHVETVTDETIQQRNALSTGDAMTSVANITPVGNGPFGVGWNLSLPAITRKSSPDRWLELPMPADA